WKVMAWVTAELLIWMGWPADNEHIKLHKEGKTTHDCPGRLIEKPWFIEQVRLALAVKGTPSVVVKPPEPVIEQKTVSHETAPQRLQEAPTPLVAPDAAIPNPVRAIKLLTAQGWPRHWAAGAIAQAQRESYPDLRPWAQGDYMLHGKLVPKTTPGAKPTAFTIWQLRDARYENYLEFAKSRGKPWDDFETQVLWCPYELKTSEKLAWKWLQKAENVDQANAAMCWYERPHGYIARRAKAATTWDEVFAVSEQCDGYTIRRGFAHKLM
ncbi:MAG TPA: phage tail tip lysozyme, partial [Candidatus Paceibacterota bacterium]